MIKVSGLNNCNQLSKESGIKNSNGYSIINPPKKLNIPPNQIKSYFVFREHAILTNNDDTMLAIGNNTDGRISNSLPKAILKTFTQFDIKDQNGQPLTPLSAFCGFSFTLYMVTNKDSTKQNHLYFSHFKIPESPLFLNINSRCPISIYGGFSYAASIDNEGQVILIYPAQIVINKNAKLDSVSLPDGEKAVSVSCCFEKLLALSSNGKVYESPVSLNKKLSFKQVTELADIEIIDISGTVDHCLALSKEGRVYARGKNNYGQLGLNEEVQDLPKFTSLSSLNDYKIEAVYAGQSHSLFRTSEGKVISCGSNIGGELLDGRDLDEIIEDGLVETSIEKGASFCIAGYGISVVFIDCDPPQNMPNKRLECFPKTRADTSNKNKQELTIVSVDEIDKMEEKRMIGQGGQSQVFKVSKNGRFYVIKELKIFGSKSGNFERFKHLQQEYEIMCMFNHPNIIKSYGICIGDDLHSPSIILEYLPFNLSKVVAELTDLQRVTAIYEISLAMSVIHMKNLIHRDLKPENILLDESKHVKVSDFGIAKFIVNENDNENDDEFMEQAPGTLKFMPPEILNDEEYDQKIDVYAFGIIMYFILTKGEYPRIGIAEVAAGKKAPIPKGINDFAKNLILRCWTTNPKNRPSFSQIADDIKKNKFMLIDGIEKEI